MDRVTSPPTWYFILSTGLVAFLILCFGGYPILRWMAALVTDAILKYLVYLIASFFNLLQSRILGIDALFTLLYIGANGICIGWGREAAYELSRRSASMLITNLILLFPGTSIAADLLHISLRTYNRIHSVVGMVVLIEGSIYAGKELNVYGWVSDMGTISGTAMFGCLGLLSAASLPVVRRCAYEIFRIIIIGICMWGATWIHRSALLVYRNFLNIHNSLQVKVKLPRPWKIKPGQYVYLTTLRPGFFLIFQRHPFMVILEGPYGNGFDLRDFGIVVLFASGIGIAGHLAYVQSLIYDYWKFKTKTRDLLLVWQVDNKRDDLLIAANLHGMRNQWESGKRGRGLGSNVTNESPGVRPIPHGENIIDVYIYGNYKILDEAGHAVPCKRAGSRIAEMEGQLDVQQIISDVLRTGVGRLAICGKLCG
ncbi:hypothetical protein PSV08DRAFT_369868 [Bipolaris maydis]|uniref:uncharacterized protein n=1 Tax=Cochliobolus heterostrophus TaxID=5016 RepID=UPI0024DBDEA5|nr:hypothetical protein J3E73DRAFT_389527 [Bipolaris maydis]KAJ6273107.1 hypothetical protein PSV08DRAFT_369868 [Bipolaris maydis]